MFVKSDSLKPDRTTEKKVDALVMRADKEGTLSKMGIVV